MKRYTTASGSVYIVAGNRVRRAPRSATSVAERVSEEWRAAEHVSCGGLGEPLVIVWGGGPDEYSARADFVFIYRDGVPVGASELSCTRTSITSPVVRIEDVGDS